MKSPNIDRLKLDELGTEFRSDQSLDSPGTKSLGQGKRRGSKTIKKARNSIAGSNSPRRKSIRENSTSSKRSSLAPAPKKSLFVKTEGNRRASIKKVPSKTQLGKPAKMSRF